MLPNVLSGYNPGYTISGTTMGVYPATNVVWQDTSSNATYCSAASALSVK